MKLSINKYLIFAHQKYNKLLFNNFNRYERLVKEVSKSKALNIMEIGVFNGAHSDLMIKACLQVNPLDRINYYGFDLFEGITEEQMRQEVAKRPLLIDEVKDKLSKINQSVKIHLYKGNTNITLPECTGKLPKMDFIFIDGGHSYETVRSDWLNSQKLMHKATVVIFDDYVNDKAISVENWGVNRLIDSIDRKLYNVKILNPVDWFEHDWGILKTRLVKVEIK